MLACNTGECENEIKIVRIEIGKKIIGHWTEGKISHGR